MNSGSDFQTQKGAFLRKLLKYVLGGACAAILVAMVILTAVDIIGRYWFNSPILGAYELTQILLSSLVFMALPLTTYSQEHVEVDIFYHMASTFSKHLMRIIGAVISSLALGVISWRLGIIAAKLMDDGAVSDALSFRLSSVAWLGCIATAISAVLALLYLVQSGLADETKNIGKTNND